MRRLFYELFGRFNIWQRDPGLPSLKALFWYEKGLKAATWRSAGLASHSSDTLMRTPADPNIYLPFRVFDCKGSIVKGKSYLKIIQSDFLDRGFLMIKMRGI